MDLKAYIRDIPDFPTPGILFKDITPLLRDSRAFRYVVGEFHRRYANQSIDVVVAVEARGFLFGAPLAFSLGLPLALSRKHGKLPFECINAEYALEYGTAILEMHKDAVTAGQRVLLVDDLLATGGTLAASARLVEELGASVSGMALVVELTELAGRLRLPQYDIFSLVKY